MRSMVVYPMSSRCFEHCAAGYLGLTTRPLLGPFLFEAASALVGSASLRFPGPRLLRFTGCYLAGQKILIEIRLLQHPALRGGP
jgi:hypothetical protein